MEKEEEGTELDYEMANLSKKILKVSSAKYEGP